MALSTQPYKGARDFYPEEKRIQKYMFGVMRSVVERFGYEEYDAPILEPLDLYTAKTGEEIVNEQTYTFTDRGDRQVAMRPEMTPSVSRMVAGRRQELAYPVRWYSIPNLWRYERPQRGRLREHWQLNVDIFGVAGIEAEHELILLADGIMQAFNADRSAYTIKLNSRKLVNSLLEDLLKLNKEQSHTISKLIDRMHKMEHSAFIKAVDEVFADFIDKGISGELHAYLAAKSINTLPESLKNHESVKSIKQLLKMLASAGITNVVFDPTVMRGFDYYTDIVFEVFDNHPENNRSMFGGGRYDGLVSLFGVEPVPTVGFGMGDVTLQNFLTDHNLMPALNPETDIYIVLIGDVYENSQKVIAGLRKDGLNVFVDTTGRKADKQIKSAVKKNVPYALFIGERELAEEQFVLKDLLSGKEERHSATHIASIVTAR